MVATDPAELVRCAGGWLCDQALAGWDVTVLTGERAEPLPLRILGARSVARDPLLIACSRVPRPQAVAVPADLYASDTKLRRIVESSLSTADVRLWGAGLSRGTDTMSHRPTHAARAFKAQALAALSVPPETGEVVETFQRAALVTRHG